MLLFWYKDAHALGFCRALIGWVISLCPWIFVKSCAIINQPIINRSTEQVDDGDEGDLLKQALAMSMTDGEEFENMRVRFFNEKLSHMMCPQWLLVAVWRSGAADTHFIVALRGGCVHSLMRDRGGILRWLCPVVRGTVPACFASYCCTVWGGDKVSVESSFVRLWVYLACLFVRGLAV